MLAPAEMVGITEIARAVAAREITAVDVLDAQLARLRDAHAATNCVAWWNEEQAYDTARELDDTMARTGPVGPLHGVPFTAKDWIDAAGLPCSGGAIELRDRRPDRDATVIGRMRAAGAVLMAKTTVQVDSPLFGPVFNALDRTRSPGASSSGEAVAVAAGGSPGGIGSDSGGSIRVPAAWNGVCGLKPTKGRVPATGHYPRVGERADGRSQIGPIAGSVADVAAILAVIAGPDGIDAGCPPVPFEPTSTGAGALAGRMVVRRGRVASIGNDPCVRHARDRRARSTVARSVVGEHELRLDDALTITRWVLAASRAHGYREPGSARRLGSVPVPNADRDERRRHRHACDDRCRAGTPPDARDRLRVHAAREPHRLAGRGGARPDDRRAARRGAGRRADVA